MGGKGASSLRGHGCARRPEGGRSSGSRPPPPPVRGSQPRLIRSHKDAGAPCTRTDRPTNQGWALDLDHHHSARQTSVPGLPPRAARNTARCLCCWRNRRDLSQTVETCVHCLELTQTLSGGTSFCRRGNQGTGGEDLPRSPGPRGLACNKLTPETLAPAAPLCGAPS